MTTKSTARFAIKAGGTLVRLFSVGMGRRGDLFISLMPDFFPFEFAITTFVKVPSVVTEQYRNFSLTRQKFLRAIGAPQGLT